MRIFETLCLLIGAPKFRKFGIPRFRAFYRRMDMDD